MAKRPEKSRPPRRRRHKRRIVNVKRLIEAILLLAIAAVVVFTLATSPMFSVKKIVVAKNHTISDAQVLSALRIPKHANIFRFDRVSALKEVRRNPVIQDVTLRRRIPSTVIITITERKPAFVLTTSGKLYQMDVAGIPFRMDKTRNPKLPSIVCQVRKPVMLGHPIKDANFAAARECLLLAQAKKVFTGIKIAVDQKSEICLNIRNEFQVKLGRPEHLTKKLDIAEQVIQQTPEFQKRGAYIDVTCPEAPAYKLKD